MNGVMPTGHFKEPLPSLSLGPAMWDSLVPCLHSSDTSTGFDLWFLIGLHFPTRLCLDWQLSDMKHSQSCFLFIQASMFNLWCVWPQLWNDQLEGTHLFYMAWEKKSSYFCFRWGWSEWPKSFCLFLRS